LEDGEFLFAGYQICNYLIVKFIRYIMPIGQTQYFKTRINEIQSKYPRLRYVCIFDEKQKIIQNIIEKAGGTVINLNEYENPREVVMSLSLILVKPKDHPEIIHVGEGEGI